MKASLGLQSKGANPCLQRKPAPACLAPQNSALPPIRLLRQSGASSAYFRPHVLGSQLPARQAAILNPGQRKATASAAPGNIDAATGAPVAAGADLDRSNPLVAALENAKVKQAEASQVSRPWALFAPLQYEFLGPWQWCCKPSCRGPQAALLACSSDGASRVQVHRGHALARTHMQRGQSSSALQECASTEGLDGTGKAERHWLRCKQLRTHQAWRLLRSGDGCGACAACRCARRWRRRRRRWRRCVCVPRKAASNPSAPPPRFRVWQHALGSSGNAAMAALCPYGDDPSIAARGAQCVATPMQSRRRLPGLISD